jgi:hypothetical protein
MTKVDENTNSSVDTYWEARQKIINQLERMQSLSSEEQRKYNYVINDYRTQLLVLDGAYAKGYAEECTKVARNLKNLGVSTDTIMQATGLSREEVENL